MIQTQLPWVHVKNTTSVTRTVPLGHFLQGCPARVIRDGAELSQTSRTSHATLLPAQSLQVHPPQALAHQPEDMRRFAWQALTGFDIDVVYPGQRTTWLAQRARSYQQLMSITPRQRAFIAADIRAINTYAHDHNPHTVHTRSTLTSTKPHLADFADRLWGVTKCCSSPGHFVPSFMWFMCDGSQALHSNPFMATVLERHDNPAHPFWIRGWNNMVTKSQLTTIDFPNADFSFGYTWPTTSAIPFAAVLPLAQWFEFLGGFDPGQRGFIHQVTRTGKDTVVVTREVTVPTP